MGMELQTKHGNGALWELSHAASHISIFANLCHSLSIVGPDQSSHPIAWGWQLDQCCSNRCCRSVTGAPCHSLSKPTSEAIACRATVRCLCPLPHERCRQQYFCRCSAPLARDLDESWMGRLLLLLLLLCTPGCCLGGTLRHWNAWSSA